ncbi:hypothetical protein VPH35_055284 [Triticum aestivum]
MDDSHVIQGISWGDMVAHMERGGMDRGMVYFGYNLILHYVYSYLPDPPVSPAATLSLSAAPSPPRRRRPHQPPPRRGPPRNRLPPPRQGRRAHRRPRLALAAPLALGSSHSRRQPPASGRRRGRPARHRRRLSPRRHRRGVPHPRGAPGPFPLRPPHPQHHGGAPWRDGPLARHPRRQGGPRTRLCQPPFADRPAPPRHHLQLRLPHPPPSRHLEAPGQHRRTARRQIPQSPGARPLLEFHGGP